MSGQYIHIKLKDSTYLMLKAKKDINLSKLGNELFTNYLENENQELPQEAILIEELESLKEQEKKVLLRISILAVQLTKVRKDSEEFKKKCEKEKDEMLDAFRLNNPLRNVKFRG